MKTLSRLAVFGLTLAFVGCGPATATLKGKVVKDGQPVGSDGQLVSLSFHPMKPDGTADATNAFTANLGGDGAFEFLASGGTLPPGQYRVVISGVSGGGFGPGEPKAKKEKPKPDKFAPHNKLDTSKLTVTVAAGANDLVVDLGKTP